MISDCFINRIDRWTEQFDIFPSYKKNNIDTIDLDDPTFFRQQILDSHQQRQCDHFSSFDSRQI
jgi:hypothetical protein